MGRFEVQALDELARFLGPKFPVHPRVLKIDRQWTLIANLVQSPDEGLPVDAAVTRSPVIPATARISAGQVGAEKTAAAV
jgi:hypothetical protein